MITDVQENLNKVQEEINILCIQIEAIDGDFETKKTSEKAANHDQDPKVLEKIHHFIYGEKKCDSFENFELANASPTPKTKLSQTLFFVFCQEWFLNKRQKIVSKTVSFVFLSLVWERHKQ